jgi:hypothetical protein
MKNIILKIIVAIVLINGIGELALSQVHILATTKLFATEIGIYLFLFIIFGLTTAFNGLLLDKRRGVILLVVSGVIAAGAGFIYLRLLQADVAAQATLTMEDVRTSALLVAASIVIYLVGSILISVLSWGNLKTTEIS